MNEHGSNNWLESKAHQAMLENGFEPEFSHAVFDQLNQINKKGEPGPNDSVRDMREIGRAHV